MKPANGSGRGWLAGLLLGGACVAAANAQPFGPEFQVTSSPDAGQEISVAASGEFIVVFSSAYRIYGRRFSPSAQPLGGDFPIGDGGRELYASVAHGPDGGFLAVWMDTDGTSFVSDIHARRFGSGGAALASEFRVNTTTGQAIFPDVAVAPSGAWLVVWTDQNDGNGDGIYAQRFTAGGTPAGGQFRVNTATLSNQRRPRVAADGQGGFVVVWYGSASGSYDVNAQKLSASGVPVGGELTVNSFLNGSQVGPFVGAGASGDFVVVWTSYDQPGDLGAGVFGQRFSGAGTKMGPEFRVNAVTTGEQTATGIFVDSLGRFVVTYGEGSAVEYVQFAADGSPKSTGQVNLDPTAMALAAPTAGNFAGAGVVIWQSAGGVFARRFALSPDPIGAEFRVNTWTTGEQVQPSVAGRADGSFVVAWASERFGYSGVYDILGQRFSSSGAPSGSAFDVSSYPPFTTNVDPTAATSGSGAFVVVWRKDTIAGSFAMARRYDASGAALHDQATVAVPGGYVGTPHVDMNGGGAFVVVWPEAAGATQTREIFGQRFSAAGSPAGARFQVNTYTSGEQEAPRVALGAAGDFVVVWASTGEDGSGNAVVARRYSSSGAPAGPPFLVNGFTGGDQDQPDVAVAPNGGFVVVWRSPEDGSGTGVVGQRFAATGVPVGSAFLVNSLTSGGVSRPRVKARDDGFVVAWRSSDLDNFVKVQLFTKSASRVGTEFQLGIDYDPSIFGFPSVAFVGADGIVAWNGVGVPLTSGDRSDVEAERLRIRLCTAGDANGDAIVNVSDVLYLINHLFANGPAPTSCANVNGDSAINVGDILYLINFLFAGGPIPI